MLKDIFNIDSYQSFFEKGGWWDMNENLQGVLNALINLLFGLIKYLVLALDYVVDQLFNLNLLSPVLPSLFTTASSIYSRLFEILGILIFTAVIVLMVHDFMSKGFAKALTRLCVFLLIYFGSLVFFQDGAGKIQEVNSLSQNVQGQLIDLTNNSTSNAKSSTAKTLIGTISHLNGTENIQNVIFDEFILKPYALLNFGKTNLTKEQFERYLVKKDTAYDDDAVKIIQDKIKKESKDNSYLTSNRMTEKIVVLINTLIMLVVIGIVILLIGIANVLIQLLLYGLIFLFPSLLFLSLLPNYHHLLKNGFLLLGTLFAGKVGLGFAFGLLFSILNLLDSFFVVTNIITMLVGLAVKVVLGLFVWKNKSRIIRALTQGKVSLQGMELNPKTAWQKRQQQKAEWKHQQNQHDEQGYKTGHAENDYLRSGIELERAYRMNEIEDNLLLQANQPKTATSSNQEENESLLREEPTTSDFPSSKNEKEHLSKTITDSATSMETEKEIQPNETIPPTISTEDIDDYLEIESEATHIDPTNHYYAKSSDEGDDNSITTVQNDPNQSSQELPPAIKSELTEEEATQLMDELSSLRHESYEGGSNETN
ncbi:hypothetical protein BOQ37_14430 [Listeria monocytogenes]|nr:hypothetical protein [Listeria monocytogenes]